MGGGERWEEVERDGRRWREVGGDEIVGGGGEKWEEVEIGGGEEGWDEKVSRVDKGEVDVRRC